MRIPGTARYAYEFVVKAWKRELSGLATYGAFNPSTDKRTLTVEAQEEIIDAYNYLSFLKRKHPDIKGKCFEIQKRAFALYRDIRELEEIERRITSEGG